MKNLRHFLVVILALGITFSAEGQIRKTVYGNNHVVKKDRNAVHFTGIRVSSGIDVYLKQTGSESITVEADENLHEYILTEIRDGVLHVYSDANIREAEMKRVYVTMKDIRSLKTSSAGDIKLELKAETVNIDISSSGDMTLSGEADMMDADLSSAGDLNAYGLAVREADVSVSSAGDADITVTEKLKARASSAGDINYRGDPKYIDAHSSSAGGIHRK